MAVKRPSLCRKCEYFFNTYCLSRTTCKGCPNFQEQKPFGCKCSSTRMGEECPWFVKKEEAT